MQRVLQAAGAADHQRARASFHQRQPDSVGCANNHHLLPANNPWPRCWCASLVLLELLPPNTKVNILFADILNLDLKNGAISIGHALYPPGQSSAGNYTAAPSSIVYTIVGPFRAGAAAASQDGLLYGQTLQRLQQYVALTAYGGALPPSGSDYCNPG